MKSVSPFNPLDKARRQTTAEEPFLSYVDLTKLGLAAGDAGDDQTPAEENAELKERLEELEAILARHARTMAAYGLDFIDTGHMMIVDRELADMGFAMMQADDDEESDAAK